MLHRKHLKSVENVNFFSVLTLVVSALVCVCFREQTEGAEQCDIYTSRQFSVVCFNLQLLCLRWLCHRVSLSLPSTPALSVHAVPQTWQHFTSSQTYAQCSQFVFPLSIVFLCTSYASVWVCVCVCVWVMSLPDLMYDGAAGLNKQRWIDAVNTAECSGK